MNSSSKDSVLHSTPSDTICKIIGRTNYSITKVLHQIPVNSPYQTQNIPDIIIEEFKPSPNFSSDLKQSVSIAKRIYINSRNI